MMKEDKPISITECFADDSVKYKTEKEKYNNGKYPFWENFRNWEKETFAGIYAPDKNDTLRDPDSYSQKLYCMHEDIWNRRCNKYNIPQVKKVKDKCELMIDKENIILGSDSFISIYWHWRDMQQLLKEKIANYEENHENLMKKEIKNLDKGIITSKRKDKCFYDEKWDDIKKFIWLYLQKSNTIGGFIVFPRVNNSINTRRGNYNGVIKDRFDLTLECIRRAYQYGDFYKRDVNPLFGISEEERAFFRMFRTFENYIDFFCLNAWVKEDKDKKGNYLVKNLLNDDETLDKWDFSTKEPLPKDPKEWWTFYDNIMNRLDARNQQIKELIKGEK